MMRIALLVYVLALLFFCSGCRSQERVSYSVETTTRTAANPWDEKVIDRVDLSITFRKSW